METINYFELEEYPNRDSLATWLILHSLNDDVMLDDDFDSKKMEVEFRINGQDLPFVKTLEDINEQLDRLVAEKAEAMLREQFGDKWQEAMDNALEKFQEIQSDCLAQVRKSIDNKEKKDG
jgi:hypothetical protein